MEYPVSVVQQLSLARRSFSASADFALSALHGRWYSSRLMVQAVKWLYLVSLALWLGSIIFLSFVVAPTVFKVLKPEDAARLQRALFPKYYLVGGLCAGVGIVCVGWLVARHGFGKWPGVLSLMLLVLMGATDLWLRQTVVPHMTEIREQ